MYIVTTQPNTNPTTTNLTRLRLDITRLSYYNVTTRLVDLVGLLVFKKIIESNLNRVRLSCCWVGVGLGCDNIARNTFNNDPNRIT